MGIDGMEWLSAIRRHYGSTDVTPWDAAAEILLGKTDAAVMAESINRRGCKIGDDVMATTTPADCEDAVEELIGLGFLESVFAAPSSGPGFACEERVLELRIP